VSYDHSSLNGGNPAWNDGYIRGAMSGGKNTVNFEASRQSRFGDSGWFGLLGWTRVLGENWYGSLFAGGSVGGIFLPKYRADAFIFRKFLSHKQLVIGAGAGYDKTKLVNYDYRNTADIIYYFPWPIVAEGGVTWTRSQPDGTLARTQFLSLTEGREKEHYITARAEIGREAYEIFGSASEFFDFPVHNYSVSYRQWLGANWGLNFTFQRDLNRYYQRNGGSLAFFVDF
jgi:YaiO family outer membrane protein